MPGERYLPQCIVNCKVWWMRNNVLGLFFMVQASPLSSSEGMTFNDILDDSVLPTLWEQFMEGPFLFQHDIAPMRKAHTEMVCRDRCGRT
jgi:hypothetical protein